MDIQIITIPIKELISIVNSERESAYCAGYLRAKAELDRVKAEPVFGELLKGVKELRAYLQYKGYWSGSLSTLSKVAPQLLDEKEKHGQRLLFRKSCIDHAFETGFHFTPLKKSKINNKAA